MNHSIFVKYLCWKPAVVYSGNSSRNSVISCSFVHMLSPAAGWAISAELFEGKRFAIPENGRLYELICSENYQDQLEITWKRPLPQNIFFLRTTGSPSWHSFGYLLPLSASNSFQEGFFYYTHFYGSEVSPGQNRRISCFCLGLLACSASRNTEMLLEEQGYPSAPIPKFESLGMLRGWFWCVNFIDDPCLYCILDTLDVLRMSDLLCRTKLTHSYSPDILSLWGVHCTEASKSISVKKIHLS